MIDLDARLIDTLRRVHKESLRHIDNFRASGINTSKELLELGTLPIEYQRQYMDTIKGITPFQGLKSLVALKKFQAKGELQNPV